MPPVYQIGRLGRVFLAAEASYATTPSFAATDALRHAAIKLGQKNNRVDAPTRTAGTPSLLYRRVRRASYDWELSGEFFPSGTLNTVPDHDEILEHGLGAKTNITLATTFSGTPTTTTGTVASATGLAVGQPVLISIASGGNAGKYVRWLTVVAGTNLTWGPALPGAPASGDSLKGCLGYKLATTIAKSLNMCHYNNQSVNYQGIGAVVDELKITFDANNEVMWSASGPMKQRTRSSVPAEPGAFTTAGSLPPSGLTGGQVINGTAVDYLRAEFTIKNALELDNFAGGTTLARGYYRNGKRSVSVALNTMVSDDVTILAISEGATDATVLVQAGATEGGIVAVYCPIVEFEVPEDQDNDGTNEFAFAGTAKGTPPNGNDEIYLAVA